ncbi:MAG: NAD(P)-binding domain-containing protein [Phycisphaerae bacterium]|nr:NAD(P)-binding domain-containing protein [Phycisphaerae bacterium]
MNILIADKFEKSGLDQLAAMGLKPTCLPDVGEAGLPAALAEHNPDILIVRGTKVRATAFEQARRLSLVIRAGAGFDNIDLTAASNRGISVATCPGKNAIAVAELAWGLILACDRRIPDQTADLRDGKWNKKEYSKARGLFGRTLGIIGLGTIGLEIAKRARAFGMEVFAASRSLNETTARALGITYCPTALDVAYVADVVAVCVAANDDTKHLINSTFCNAMKPGAYLINTSRGTVVDETALLRAIKEKGIRAGLDVFENEPAAATADFKSELASSPAVCGSHHVGASTDQAQQAIADEVVRIVRLYRETGEAPGVINIARSTAATRLLSVRHLNRPGVLAHVVGEIGKAGINIEDMQNVIYQGAEAACARIKLDAEPSASVMNNIRTGSPHILSVDLTSIE